MEGQEGYKPPVAQEAPQSSQEVGGDVEKKKNERIAEVLDVAAQAFDQMGYGGIFGTVTDSSGKKRPEHVGITFYVEVEGGRVDGRSVHASRIAEVLNPGTEVKFERDTNGQTLARVKRGEQTWDIPEDRYMAMTIAEYTGEQDINHALLEGSLSRKDIPTAENTPIQTIPRVAETKEGWHKLKSQIARTKGLSTEPVAFKY